VPVVALAAAVMPGQSPVSAQSDSGQSEVQGRDLGPCPEDLNAIAAADSTVRIVKVAGLIDPVVQGHLLSELRHAESSGVLGLVIWMNSRGSVLSAAQFQELASALAESSVYTAIWVGQSGSTARGGAAELLGVVDLVGVSSGSTIGDTGPARLPDTFGPAFGAATERLQESVIGADEAIQLGISAGPVSDVSTIGPFVSRIPGYQLARCTNSDGALVSLPLTRNELTGLPITAQLFHTVSSPEVAYLFFVMGLGLLLFELYTAGIGIAGVIGAGLLALGCFGLANLPTRWWGVGLLVAAFLAMAVDVQTNVPRYYTAVGFGLFVVGTFTLYHGVGMSWVTYVAGIVGAALYAWGGMPSMVRTRFSTPTIGRTWMIGEMGQAITDVAPEGTVRIRDVAWRAITNRATPVKAGDPVRVVGLERLVLEIEPEEGGAKDYRQRR
jgi:membrane-bound serine protease (ClpP class)